MSDINNVIGTDKITDKSPFVLTENYKLETKIVDAEKATSSSKFTGVEETSGLLARSPVEIFETQVPRLPDNEQELMLWEFSNNKSVQITYLWHPVTLYVGQGVSRDDCAQISEDIYIDFVDTSIYGWIYNEIKIPNEDGTLIRKGSYIRHHSEAKKKIIEKFLKRAGTPDTNKIIERLKLRLDFLKEIVVSCPKAKSKTKVNTDGLQIEAAQEDKLISEIEFINLVVGEWENPLLSTRHPIFQEVDSENKDSHIFTMQLDLNCGILQKHTFFLPVPGISVHFKTNEPSGNSNKTADIISIPSEIDALSAILDEVLAKKLPDVKIDLIIRGYADSTGNKSHNKNLSSYRAEFIRQEIKKQFEEQYNSISIVYYGDYYARKLLGKQKSNQSHRVAIVEVKTAS